MIWRWVLAVGVLIPLQMTIRVIAFLWLTLPKPDGGREPQGQDLTFDRHRVFVNAIETGGQLFMKGSYHANRIFTSGHKVWLIAQLVVANWSWKPSGHAHGLAASYRTPWIIRTNDTLWRARTIPHTSNIVFHASDWLIPGLVQPGILLSAIGINRLRPSRVKVFYHEINQEVSQCLWLHHT